MNFPLNFVTLLLAITCFSQNDEYIFKGVLKSRQTNEEIPFASVTLKKKLTGVVANEKGQFEFHIPRENWNDAIEIEAMGFKTYSEPVSGLLKIPYHTIILTDTAYSLNEVVVYTVSAEEMVLRALNASDSTFPASPYEMDCFYRMTKKENGKYTRLLESLFKAYDRGFNYSNIPASVEIDYNFSTRVSKDYSTPGARLPYPFFRPQYLLTIENYIRNKAVILDNIKHSVYDFEYETPKYLGGKMIYVISAKTKENVKKFAFDVKFYIRPKNYAIMQVDFDGTPKIKYLRPKGLPPGLSLDVKSVRSTYVFKEFEGRMYMHYLNDYASYDWYRKKVRMTNCEENSEAIIQNVSYPTTGKPTFSFFPKRIIAALIPTNYAVDSAKWNNEMVKQIPFDPAIKIDLEKEMPLEDQFLNKNQKNE